MGANNAELRFLTVENTATGTYTVPILNLSTSPSLIHVTATALTGSTIYGIYNYNSNAVMTNVTVNVRDSMSAGVANYGSGTIKINHSIIRSLYYTIANNGPTTLVANTLLDGDSLPISAITCAGVYDENYTFYANS